MRPKSKSGQALPQRVDSSESPLVNCLKVLGAIDLYGVVLQKKLGNFDLFASANWDSLRPNGQTTPFGGLGSDPFETPANQEGHMFYLGARYSIPQDDGRTKIGVEFNQGSKYWFNFSNAEDDIIAPNTDTRGQVYESYLTHRIADHFILKAGFIRYNYTWSNSGWHIGAPKRLDSNPILGFRWVRHSEHVHAGSNLAVLSEA